MKRKWYMGLLTLLLAISMILSACGGGGSGSGSSSSGSSSSGGSGGSSGGSGSSGGGDSPGYTVSPAGVLPIVDEPVEITITTPRRPTVTSYEYGENDLTTWVTDVTGVKINWNLYPSTDSMDKLNLELSSGGDVGDLLMNFGDIDRAFLITYGSQGVFTPLNDLIEEYGDNIKDVFADFPGYKQGITAPDGNIYALFNVGMCYNCDLAKRFWVHQGFLDTLGMDVPQTTDELYEFLKAVKENDVNGNGDPNDEIGIVGAPPSWYSNVHDFILNAFTKRSANELYVENDTVIAAFLKEEFREGLRYLNKLYSEGLIDPTSFTNDENQRKQIVELEGGNTVAAVPAGGEHVFAVEESTRMKYTIVPPLEGPTGLRYAFKNEYSGIGNPMFIIPSTSKHPEVVMRLIDFFYSHESYMRGRYGIEGVHWEKPEEGVIAANGGQAQYRIIGKDMWQEQQSIHWHGANNGRPSFGSDARERLPEGQFDLETSLYEAAVLYDQFTVEGSMVPPFFFDTEDAARYNELRNEINRYLDAAIADFIVGTRDLDKDWDRYIQELEAIGVQEYLEIQQAEYDRNWKN